MDPCHVSRCVADWPRCGVSAIEDVLLECREALVDVFPSFVGITSVPALVFGIHVPTNECGEAFVSSSVQVNQPLGVIFHRDGPSDVDIEKLLVPLMEQNRYFDELAVFSAKVHCVNGTLW